MPLRGRRVLIMPNLFRRAAAYPRPGGVSVVTGRSINMPPVPVQAQTPPKQ